MSAYEILLDPTAPVDQGADTILEVPTGIALGDLAELLSTAMDEARVETMSVVIGGVALGRTTRVYLDTVFCPGFAGQCGATRYRTVRYECVHCGRRTYRLRHDEGRPPRCWHGEMTQYV
jgi:hypothetical protein